jgi:acetolactate synthase-1/2/3 large subunit
VQQLFCVPGESYLAVLDALHDAHIAVTVCRQEGGAAMMAEAQGKLTGQPGICFVTRGPGATNAAAGIHIAHQDSTPMILFVGQVARGAMGREAFQELDYRAVFGTMAKWVVQIDDPARMPELVSRAFHVATSGRPGPVVVALPEDMLTEAATVADALALPGHRNAPRRRADGRAGSSACRRHSSPWPSWAAAAGLRRRCASSRRLPRRGPFRCTCSFRRQMLFPATHACYGGDLGLGVNPKLLARIKASDLVLVVGGRLSEVPSQGYELFDIPTPAQPLVHVHADADELGKLYRPTQAIHATPQAFAAALNAVRPRRPCHGRPHRGCACRIPGLERPGAHPHPRRSANGRGDAAPARQVMPADTIFCNGAGNFATWVHRFWPFTSYASQLAPTSGSMGYGLPAVWAPSACGPARSGGVCGRRRLSDARPGICHRRAVRPAHHRGAAGQRPTPRPLAATASAWSAPKTLPRPWPAPAPAACPACCTA